MNNFGGKQHEKGRNEMVVQTDSSIRVGLINRENKMADSKSRCGSTGNFVDFVSHLLTCHSTVGCGRIHDVKTACNKGGLTRSSLRRYCL